MAESGSAGALAQNECYLRDALALGDKQPVFATIAIYSSTGIKLVNPGARVTSAMFERLVRHKLAPPIDKCLSVENGVDVAELERGARELLTGDARFARVTAFVPRETVLAAFRHAVLAPPLLFKLTVAREQRPAVYAHSMEVALLAVFLAAMGGTKLAGLAMAATAGLLLDIGILHIPPDVLGSGKRLSDADRNYLYAHPAVACLIVREYAELHPVVSTAIREHHERLDGSGYPQGLNAAQISDLGKILMLADAGAALLKSGARGQGSIALRLLRRKFDPKLLGYLSGLISPLEEAVESAAGGSRNAALTQLPIIAELLLAWGAARADLLAVSPAADADPLFALVHQRIVALERTLLEAGFIAQQSEAFTHLAAADPTDAQEMSAFAREALWQLTDITLEARRRLVSAQEGRSADARAVIEGWLAAADAGLAAL